MVRSCSIALLFSVGLAACGGSGGASDTGDTTSPLTPGASATAAPVPAPPTAPVLPPSDGGAPAPEPPACIGGGGGNANGVCTADTEILTNAEKECALGGFRITAFEPDESCGVGSSSSFTFACCARLPPAPPPPPPCIAAGFASGGGACTPDAQIAASAVASCQAQKLTLTSLSTDDKCGPGSSTSGTYTCCPIVVGPDKP